MKERVLMLLACFCLSMAMVMAQTSKVTGIVTSSDDGEPVIGASVLVKGTAIGTITGVNGDFTIPNVPASAKTLMISYVGFKTQEVAIKPGTLKIVLVTDTETLDEVVVTAQGLTRKQKSLGYSTQKVKGEDLTIARQGDLGNAMAGKISGARYLGTSGATFGAGSIYLRGSNSISNVEGSEPIYVVDGSITNKNSVNMDDVDNINVLKGPAATAMYGSRGANGAIIITSKSAKATGGKGRLEVSHTLQFEKAYIHMDLQDQYGGGSLGAYNGGDPASSFYTYHWKEGDGAALKALDGKYYMDYGSDESWGARFDKGLDYIGALAWDPTSSKYGQLESWSPQLKMNDLFRTGVMNTTNVSFSKSGQDYNTRVSFTNSARTGVQPNSDAIRRYLTVKTDFKPTSWMNVSLDYKYTYRKNHNSATEGFGEVGNVLQEYLQWGQTNVNLKDYKDYARPDGSWRTWNIKSPTNLGANFHDNPYATMDLINTNDIYQWNVFTGDVSIDLPFDIKGGVRVIGNLRNQKYEDERPDGSINYVSRYYQYQNSLVDLTIQGRLTWGAHLLNDRLGIDAAAFIEQRDYTYDQIKGYTQNGLTINGYYNLLASSSSVYADNTKTHYRERSIYGTVTLGWDDTYFIDGSLRNDWSSTLSPNHNSFLYGGLSVSAMANKWFPGAHWLNMWKLRASAAQVGSTIDAYNINNVFELTTKYGNWSSMREPVTQKNFNIKPSISTSYEVGTEFSMFNRRLWGDVNFYTRDSKDQIIDVTSAPQSGFTTRKMNAGLIRNQGFEVSIGGMPVMTKDFSWTLDFNIARNTNKLIELADGIDSYMIYGIKFQSFLYKYAQVGKSLGVITGNTWNRDENGNIIFKKLTNATQIANNGEYIPTYNTDTDRELGNFQPDFTGGFSTNLRYKNFRLGASFDFSIGGQMASWTNMWGTASGTLSSSVGNNDKGKPIRESLANGGGIHMTGVDTEGNKVDTYVGAYYFMHNQCYVWEDWIYDRTYVKMRELSLGYEVPTSFLQKTKTGITSASISLVATNPWLIYSAVPNIDPSESSNNYYEGGQAVSTRSIGLTVNLAF